MKIYQAWYWESVGGETDISPGFPYIEFKAIVGTFLKRKDAEAKAAKIKNGHVTELEVIE